MKKYIVILVLVFWMGTGLSIAADALPRVKLTTSQGDVVLELNSAAAPKTVDNFLAYVKDGYYDGAIFHRVIAGFMIQGGGFDAEMKRKSPRPPIVNEADNGLPNRTGTIAMARTADPHSASAQFFINVKDNAFLDHRGKTAQGLGILCIRQGGARNGGGAGDRKRAHHLPFGNAGRAQSTSGHRAGDGGHDPIGLTKAEVYFSLMVRFILLRGPHSLPPAQLKGCSNQPSITAYA